MSKVIGTYGNLKLDQGASQSQTAKANAIFKKLHDPAFKQALESDPAAVLGELGVSGLAIVGASPTTREEGADWAGCWCVPHLGAGCNGPAGGTVST